MNKYELLVILSAEIDDEAKEALVAKISDLIVNNGGTIDGVDRWGVKKFAYPINYKNEGYYVLMNITANSETPNTVEKVLNITENVVRCMFVRK